MTNEQRREIAIIRREITRIKNRIPNGQGDAQNDNLRIIALYDKMNEIKNSVSVK